MDCSVGPWLENFASTEEQFEFTHAVLEGLTKCQKASKIKMLFVESLKEWQKKLVHL